MVSTQKSNRRPVMIGEILYTPQGARYKACILNLTTSASDIIDTAQSQLSDEKRRSRFIDAQTIQNSGFLKDLKDSLKNEDTMVLLYSTKYKQWYAYQRMIGEHYYSLDRVRDKLQ